MTEQETSAPDYVALRQKVCRKYFKTLHYLAGPDTHEVMLYPERFSTDDTGQLRRVET